MRQKKSSIEKKMRLNLDEVFISGIHMSDGRIYSFLQNIRFN